MKIRLSRGDILKALPRVAKGLGKYLILQTLVECGSDLSRDEVFQKRYNGFYKVRRNAEWRNYYFKILETKRHKKKSEEIVFLEVLKSLYDLNGKAESSFASKLVATLDPLRPVIDSIVLKNLGLKIPRAGTPQKLIEIAKIYDEMTECYHKYLETEDGGFLVDQFKKHYPKANISSMKMLDFVLWQTR